MWKVAWGVVVGLFLFFVGLPMLGVLLLIGGLALQHHTQQPVAPTPPNLIVTVMVFVIGIGAIAFIVWRRLQYKRS